MSDEVLRVVGIGGVEEVRRMLEEAGVGVGVVRRCQECGVEFEPSRHSVGHQLNCGEGCRERRKRRRARERKRAREGEGEA